LVRLLLGIVALPLHGYRFTVSNSDRWRCHLAACLSLSALIDNKLLPALSQLAF
jgi:hypothetical protein